MVKIEGFIIEKYPDTDYNFFYREHDNLNYSRILSEKSTPDIDHNLIKLLYHPQPQQHHNFVVKNIPNPNHSPIFLEMATPTPTSTTIFFNFATPTPTLTTIFENLQPPTQFLAKNDPKLGISPIGAQFSVHPC